LNKTDKEYFSSSDKIAGKGKHLTQKKALLQEQGFNILT